MATIGDIRRVVFGHEWRDIKEWARAIEDLADLSDDEIDGVVDGVSSERHVPASLLGG